MLLTDKKQPDLSRNIKVNVKKIVAGKAKRTSTTLNYAICDFLFGKVLDPQTREKLTLTDATKYRHWLEQQAQEWVNTQSLATQQQLETALAQAIYENGVKNGRETLL